MALGAPFCVVLNSVYILSELLSDCNLLLSPATDEVLQKSFDRAVLLDLQLKIRAKAGNHATGNGAGDLLSRRLAGFVVLFNEESFSESLDVGVGFLCHRVIRD